MPRNAPYYSVSCRWNTEGVNIEQFRSIYIYRHVLCKDIREAVELALVGPAEVSPVDNRLWRPKTTWFSHVLVVIENVLRTVPTERSNQT